MPLLVIDNLDDLLELRDILPTYMRCGKLKAGDSDWIDAALYLERSYEVRLSHGYCPACLNTLTEAGDYARRAALPVT